MRNIFKFIKNYKYKLFTPLLLGVILNVIGYIFNLQSLVGIAPFFLFIAMTYVYIMFWVGVINTWNDGDKVLSAILGLIGTVFIGTLGYIVCVNL